MKKNFLTAAAITVIAFFVATTIAQAADVNFSGQVRTRWESNGQSGGGAFNDASDNDDFIATRVRLNANVNVNDSTSAFIQMQSNRTWGNNNGTAGTLANNAGSGNSSFSPSDADASVGLHQAYFTLKNFATLPVDLQMGRQEVVLDGHRLFGNTGWTTGAQTHDAIRLTHAHDNMALVYAYVLGNEGDRTNDPGDLNDTDVHLVYGSLQGILGGTLSVTFAGVVDGCGVTATATCSLQANDIYTIGFRQAGQLFGIDYRGEYYHQWGDARADATRNAANLNHTALATQASIDRDAYMFGLRIGKKFNNVMMKPSLTFWYDQLSGTDDSDVNGNEWGGFNTLFDTGHKFYGHMDLFLDGGSGGGGTQGLGLVDMAIKGSIQPMAGWTVKAAFHWFETEVDPNSNATARGPQIAAGVDEDLGTELDLALVHKYNANTVISAGYSVFNGEQLFNLQRQTTEDADWAYVSFDVKF
ncbi:MAG: DUF3373 family protein [Nitrospina sp.]|jgi:hypothetical protein|nr:DUF3373 family protein [Nitrospina sp.]MBT3855461.1 DUF3373 family protein [Nitrospina sp.]MBT4103664.1 DUF3373 family protein [Nitrospina sp.]MBT4388423.1 DUF3373 family protein [Nitrospina sp.]MBT4621399.1 DUF3373 family protein [Nitrospina sp.]